jgi:cytochrome o ubiquinol oxidase subunit 3
MRVSELNSAVDSYKINQASLKAEADSKTYFGFWVYLMTDCVLFASLFATFAVLHANTFNGPSAHSLFSLPYALAETLILLTSSFTCGLAILAAQNKAKRLVLFWLLITFLLGLAFLVLEFREFANFVNQGDSWRRSGFLSSYFTLVATHGLHITIGLLWIGTMMFQVLKKGLNRITVRQLTLMSLFWHFLDLIWIFIFSVVYLISGGLNI